MTVTVTASAPPPAPPRPAAPPRVVLGAVVVGVAAALLLPYGPPGAGVLLVALLLAGAVAALRGRRASGWQRVHATAAVLLAAAPALRDAPPLVALDLVAAVALCALAVVPTATWAGLLTALPRVGLRVPAAAQALARGLGPLLSRGRGLDAYARGLVLTAGLLAVFVPLLVSADEGFAALLGDLPDLPRAAELPGRLAVLVVVATGAATVLLVAQSPPADLVLPAPTRLLRRTSEWLLPLAALDLLLAAFLAVQSTVQPSRPATSYSAQLHAGFWQLLAVTALVLAVVAAAVRWTPGGRGVRALLAALCLLTLAVDGSALARLAAYTDAYGLTRLRYAVAVVCLLLGAVLVLVLVAGARRGPQRWLPHGVVLAGALALLGATAADPDAAVARSAVARGPAADTAYLATLSADAVPELLALPSPQRDCVLAAVRDRLPEGGGWGSANLARARADRLLPDGLVGCGLSPR